MYFFYLVTPCKCSEGNLDRNVLSYLDARLHFWLLLGAHYYFWFILICSLYSRSNTFSSELHQVTHKYRTSMTELHNEVAAKICLTHINTIKNMIDHQQKTAHSAAWIGRQRRVVIFGRTICGAINIAPFKPHQTKPNQPTTHRRATTNWV